MKAKNTKTGEIVTDFGFSKEFGTVSYVDSHGVLRFGNPCDGEWKIIIKGSNGGFDWVKYRGRENHHICLCMIDKLNSNHEVQDKRISV
jgi:hypothetical protein